MKPAEDLHWRSGIVHSSYLMVCSRLSKARMSRPPAGRALRLIAAGILACFFLTASSAHAQRAARTADDRFTLVLRGTTMDDALEQLARLTRIDLVYSSELAAEKTVYCDGRGLAPEDLLKCILSGSGLDYVRSSGGTYVLIEALRTPPRRGHLGGRIIDGASGDPLPSANVLLADASTGTVTDAAGFFSFSSLVSGVHTIVATYVGYRTAVDSIVVIPGEGNIVEIALTPEPLSLGPIVIDGLTQRLPSQELGAGRVSSAHPAAQSPLGTTDVTRAAATVGGVSVRHPLADLHIQGSAGGDHLTMLDGAPVRDPVTLGRHLGAFSPLAVDRITVHKAGFGASRGSHVSGVVMVDHDVSPQQGSTASISLDPLSFNGKLQGRAALSGERSVSGMIAARTALWDVFRDPGLENLLDRWNAVDPILAGIWIGEEVTTSSLISRRHIPELGFSDLHAAGRMQLNPFHTAHASVYRARNRIASELAAVNSASSTELDRLFITKDDYDWTNWAGQIRHAWLAGARSVVTTQLRASSHASQYRYLSLYDGLPRDADDADVRAAEDELRARLRGAVGSDEENRIHEVALHAGMSRSLSPGGHIDMGLEAARVSSRFMLGNQFIRPFSHESNVWEFSGYVENRLTLGLRTSVEPGVRVTYLPARRTVYAEPRLAVRYDGESSALGAYALRVAGGVYRQFIPSLSLTSSGSTSAVPFVRFWMPVDRSLAPERAYHLTLEALVIPGSNWQFAFEGYHKWEPRLLEVDYRTLVTEYPAFRPRPSALELPQSTFVHALRGRSLGALGRMIVDIGPLSTMFQYSFSRAERIDEDRFRGRWQPVPWNEPHSFLVRASYAIAPGLTLHTSAECVWGRRWAFRRAYYDYLAFQADAPTFAPFTLDDPSSPVLPHAFRIDPGLTFDWSRDRARVRLRAVLVNVLDRHDVFDWSLENGGGDHVRLARSMPGRRPVFSLHVSY